MKFLNDYKELEISGMSNKNLVLFPRWSVFDDMKDDNIIILCTCLDFKNMNSLKY